MLQEFPMYSYIPANDVARARRFYEGKLGFEPGEEFAGGVSYQFAGGTACYLYPADDAAGTSKASQAFWQVKGLEKLMARLRERGVAFEEYDLPDMKTVNGIFADGSVKAAWFKDTEGNIMALIEDIR